MARGREGGACLVDQSSPSCPSQLVGGKGHNLWVLGSMEGCQVPDWFCITTDAFSTFIEVCGASSYTYLYIPKILYLHSHMHCSIMDRTVLYTIPTHTHSLTRTPHTVHTHMHCVW